MYFIGNGSVHRIDLVLTYIFMLILLLILKHDKNLKCGKLICNIKNSFLVSVGDLCDLKGLFSEIDKMCIVNHIQLQLMTT